MPTFWSTEWVNMNSQRNYPLAEHASGRDTTDSIKLPESFLVALYLPVAAVVEVLPDRFYIKTIAVVGGGYTIDIAYNDGTPDPPLVASSSISAINFTENSYYALVGVNQWDDTVGKIVIGRLEAIGQLPAGIYNFSPTSGALDTDCIRPMIRGVSSLIAEQGSQRGPKLRNNVVLQAGRNISLQTIVVAGQDPVIRIDAIPDEAFEECACVEREAPCIRTINDEPGDARQNFNLLGDNCLNLVPITNGLQLVDQCCAPCCGCEELNVILTDLRGVRSMAATLNSVLTKLDSEQTQLRIVVNSAQLTSGGCGG